MASGLSMVIKNGAKCFTGFEGFDITVDDVTFFDWSVLMDELLLSSRIVESVSFAAPKKNYTEKSML